MAKDILKSDVISIFEEIAKKYSQKIAVADDKKSITYAQLDNLSNAVAKFLISENIQPEAVIPIIVDRSVNAVIEVFGILKANAAYMPVDVLYPPERINYMIKMSGSHIVLCASALDVPKIQASVSGDVKVLSFEKDVPESFKKSFEKASVKVSPDFSCDLDNSFEKKAISFSCDFEIKNKRTSNSLSYVIFTSGSEGKPKGVMIEDSGIVRLVKETNFFPFSDELNFLQSGTLCFDAATFDVFGALLNGASLFMVEKNTLLDPNLLKEKLQNYKIDSMFLTTPLFHQLVTADVTTFESLKNLIVGGDVLFLQDALLLNQKYPELNLYNGYGPTENTTFSTVYKIKGNEKTDIPIGLCIANSTAYVLDENLKPVLQGEKGELYVGGPGVARGYLGNDELTRQKFLPDLSGKGRMYKTGDLVSQDKDGIFHYFGRLDSQIKFRGFRIELSEIQKNLLALENISDCFVCCETFEGEKKNIAFIKIKKENNRNDEKSLINEIRKNLEKKLPEYMIPGAFVIKEDLPLNLNGKVDKQKLLDEYAKKNEIKKNNEEQNVISKILIQNLNANICDEDNLFELGFNSISAIHILSAFRKEGFDISMKAILSAKTVGELKALVERGA